jgi:diguanylate cyclase (GGDEF)-like protein
MKRWLGALPIHYKLTLLMTIISAVTLGVAVSMFAASQLATLERSAIENILAKAVLISASVEPAIIFDDERSAKNTLKQLENDPSIEYAAVILPDKQILASYQKDSELVPPAFNLEHAFMIGSNYLDARHPIKVQDGVIGFVFIRSNLEKLKKQRADYGLILVYILLAGTFLAYALSIYSQRIITMPIKSMVEHIERIYTSKNYQKHMDVDREDELGRLVAGFNHMLTAVQKREDELQNHGDHLQALVDMRTEQLHHKAYYDSLTGLPNRYLLFDRLQHAIKTAPRERRNIGLLFLDLDRFKIINDNLGHGVGDQLLKAVAQRLSDIGRDGDTIARLGGDEFVFLLEHVTQPERIAGVAQRIIHQLSHPFQLEEHIVHVTTSIGISIFPEDGDDEETLLKNADISMYHAKEKGPSQYCFYKDEMNKTSLERLNVENNLRDATRNGEFGLVYQPQVCLQTDSVKSVEALIRWESPILGAVSPATFIPIAEEIGIINDIGYWVLGEVCRQVAHWRDKGINDIKVAVNISASHIMSPNLIEYIKEQVGKYQIRFDQLEIEITEDVFLNHSDRIIELLHEIKKLGVTIAIDDFGTGYSSLRYIQQFPVDKLKLDGMFIKDLENSSSSRGIVSSTIILAHSLGLDIVSECVETEAQLAFLKKQQCDCIQGFLLYRPETPENIEKIIEEQLEPLDFDKA